MGKLADKLAFNRELPRHLRELQTLVGRPVCDTELLSLAETRNVRAQANEVMRDPVMRRQIPFEERTKERFSSFLKHLAEANPHDVYLWTPASNACGLLRPVPISTLNLAFPFELNPEGIFVILTSDLCDQLLLDYSLGDQNEQVLELEARGEHWGSVAY